jgi:hypothetical protein
MPPKEKTKNEHAPDEPETEKPDSNAAVAAAGAEILDRDIEFDFRGEKFTVPAAIQKSARVIVAAISGEQSKVMYEVLIHEHEGRMMRLAKPMESAEDFLTELYEAYDKAVGARGNS